MPKVYTTDGYLIEWDKSRIVKQLLRETELARTIFGREPMDEITAYEIASIVEDRILQMNPRFMTGAMIREMVNNVLLEESDLHPEFLLYRNLLTRVGAPVYDAFQIYCSVSHHHD